MGAAVYLTAGGLRQRGDVLSGGSFVSSNDPRVHFGLGDSDKMIGFVDAQGVALAAIQGLNQKLQEQSKIKEAEIQQLKRQLEKLEQQMNQKAGGAN